MAELNHGPGRGINSGSRALIRDYYSWLNENYQFGADIQNAFVAEKPPQVWQAP
jgi:hypothetical protein